MMSGLFPELENKIEKDKSKKELKAINLFAGIGGNRKLWDEVHPNLSVTAVEFDKNIAEAYRDRYPGDNVIVADAIAFLIDNYKDYDYIWLSPPCPTHCRPRFAAHGKSNYGAVMPRYEVMAVHYIFKVAL